MLALDAINPQSRPAGDGVPLLACARARATGEKPRPRSNRIAACPTLSRDLHDIVTRTLAR